MTDHGAPGAGSDAGAAPDPEGTRPADHLRSELVRLVRALRDAGASVPANAATTAGRALAAVGLADRDRVRTALRASLLVDRADFETFERLFDEFWRRLAGGRGGDAPTADDAPEAAPAPLDARADDGSVADRDAGDGGDDGAPGDDRSLAESIATAGVGDGDDGTTTALYSPSGSGGPVDGGPPAVAGDLGAAMAGLTRALSGLRGRRFGPGDEHPDVRRALRASVGTGGVVPSVPRRDRRRSAVRAVLLVDVSRSVLDAVDRGFLVDFLRRACREWRDARVFFFDEDLREVTGPVDAPSPTAAMAALEAAETAWGGGTRIGASIATLRGIAPEAVDRRTVAFVVSDGLEMGDVSVLEREVAWLARRAKRLFWLNPLAADDAYEPAARGMAAALPYLDGLFAFAAPADVAELSRQLRRHGPGGRVGYEFDPRRRGGREPDEVPTAGTGPGTTATGGAGPGAGPGAGTRPRRGDGAGENP